MDFIKLWICNDFLDHAILPALNEQMDLRREKLTGSNAGHRGAVSQRDFYNFLFRYFLDLLIGMGQLSDHLSEINDIKSALMGVDRSKEISASCVWTTADVAGFHFEFNQRAPSLLTIGSIVTIDETLLAYFGEDARVDHIDRCMPGKPHDYGLLSYRAGARLSNTKARVTVALAPIIPGHSYTPTAAALHLIQMIRVWQRGSAHFVMDSAFATEEMVNSARSMNVAVSLSMKSNRTAGYAPVYELATSRLEPGEARSYAFDGYIMQTRCAAKPHKRGGLPVHAVLSSGWRTPPHGSAPIKRLLDYVSVKTLYLNNTAEELMLAFGGEPGWSKRDIILAKTNWDLLAPPPEENGEIAWTKESLAKMMVPLLKDLHAITPHCSGASRKNSEQLIEDIVKNHPHARAAAQRLPRHGTKAKDVVSLRDEVGRATSNSTPVLDFYAAEYGVVDEINQEIYRSIMLSWHRDWQKLLGFSVLHAMVMNAHSCFVEWHFSATTHDSHGARIAFEDRPRLPFAEFIFTACKQAVAEKRVIPDLSIRGDT